MAAGLGQKLRALLYAEVEFVDKNIRGFYGNSYPNAEAAQMNQEFHNFWKWTQKDLALSQPRIVEIKIWRNTYCQYHLQTKTTPVIRYANGVWQDFEEVGVALRSPGGTVSLEETMPDLTTLEGLLEFIRRGFLLDVEDVDY